MKHAMVVALGCRDAWAVAGWLRARPEDLRVLRSLRVGICVRDESVLEEFAGLWRLGLIYVHRIDRDECTKVLRLTVFGAHMIDLIEATER